jgi:pimeloyl-ACP methyl ester carboxylesterase
MIGRLIGGAMSRRTVAALALCGIVSVAHGADPPQWKGPWNHVRIQAPSAPGSAGLAFHALESGPTEAPVVVLLHGFPDLSWGWRRVIPLLAGDFHVIAPDLRGYGGTDKPEAGYDLATLATDIIGLIEAVSPGRPVHLLAHDWGAAIAWQVATVAPERLSTLVVMDVPHPAVFEQFLREDRAQRRASRYMGLLANPAAPRALASLPPRRLDSLYQRNLNDRSVFSAEDAAVYRAAFAEPGDWRPPLAYYVAMRERRAAARLGRASGEPAPIEVATLVLWGEDDAYVLHTMAQPSCERVSARCEVTTWPETGHWLQWERPREVVERFRAFIRGP